MQCFAFRAVVPTAAQEHWFDGVAALQKWGGGQPRPVLGVVVVVLNARSSNWPITTARLEAQFDF